MTTLRDLARREAPETALERCELCGTPIGPEHRHLLELPRRELRCTCRACSLLFDRPAAGGGHYKIVPERRVRLDGFALDDVMWEELRLPVDLAFFFRNGDQERVQAFYPGPMGATESLLRLEAWEALERANPILATLADDVEALLVNRALGAREHFLVPIDDCFRLVGIIRTQWRGFTGGREVWQEINAFFEELT